MIIEEITFQQAAKLAANPDTENYPVPTLSEQGRGKVCAFADEFYGFGAYNESAVFTEFENEATDLLRGTDHIVELRRPNGGNFKVQTYRMDAEDYDWSISK
jgi:hypothetical protein